MSALPNTMPMASWQSQTRSMHIRNVIIASVIFVIVLVFVILVFTVPKCNSTQVRGFFTCNCKPGSALDRSTGYCKCLNDGATPGGQCIPGAEQERFVTLVNTFNDLTKKDWAYDGD